MVIKRNTMVRAVRDKLQNSLEAQANDPMIPEYVFTTKGQVLETNDDYALVKFFTVPTPPIWFRQDQLEEYEEDS